MKWSSASNSSLSALALNISNASNNNNNNNNSIGSSGSSKNSSYSNVNGGSGNIRTKAAAVRRHASDRRSIFYTDPDDMEIFTKNHNNKKMPPKLNPSPTSANGNSKPNNATKTASASNAIHRSESAQSRLSSNSSEADEMQRRKCENLISYFTNQIYHLNKELEIEKNSRDTHFSKIVKALLCFEAKLKSDQKQIRQQLYEKDTQLNRLAGEIISLREKYGDKDEEAIQIDPVAQYCTNCRKQYYFLNSSDIGTQVSKRELTCHDDVDKENGVRRASSSDDGLGQVFSSEARRSKRYMSKRTPGTFREYLKSRSIELNQNNDNSNGQTNDTSPQRPAASLEQQQSTPVCDALTRKGSMRRSNKSAAFKKCDKKDNKMNETTTTSSAESMNDSTELPINTTNDKMTTKCAAVVNNAFLKKYDDEVGKPKTQFESTDDWYASASDMDDSDGAVSKPYGYNAVNPVLECVNQILLQQSMDGIMDNCANGDEKTFTGPTTATTTTTATNSPTTSDNLAESPSKETTNTNTTKKRVHFSTQNSMVQVPRSDNSSNFYQMSTAITSTEMCTTKESILSYATIYGNEYEPVGSENNSTNHYVDMDSKLGDDRPLIEKSKTPPALPPKPPNLLKFRNILKMPAYPMQTTTIKPTDNESEPDYCSIGDIQEAVKSVQIVADVHKNADDDVSSHASEETKTDITDETFADIPKLPNVQAIISPKKDPTQPKTTVPDNHGTKMCTTPPRAKQAVFPSKATNNTNILSDMNKNKNAMIRQKSKFIAESDDNVKKNPPKFINQHKVTMSTISETYATNPPQTISMKTLPIIKQNEKLMMPIQAEFDWYNFDEEYGKPLKGNLIENGKDSESDEPKNYGVEYNLDAEFSLTSCSLSSDNNSSIESSGSTIHFVPITVAEDCNANTNVCVSGNATVDDDLALNSTHTQLLNPARLKKLISKSATTNNMSNNVNDKSFDAFLEQTGLTTKPLPQKRKIFYNAPFV